MLPTPLIFLATLITPGNPVFGPVAPTESQPSQPAAVLVESPGFALGAITAVTATPAPAADETGWKFSYTFLEVGATRTDLDQIDDTADAYYGLASLDLFDLVYIFLGYENSSIDFQNTDTDLWTVGAGVHFPVAPRLDVLADLAFVFSDLSSDTLSESSNGHQLRAGARWLAMEFGKGGLELAGRAIWIDLDRSYLSDNSVIGFDLEARVHFLEHLSVGAAYKKLEDDDAGALNARFSF